MSDYFELFEIPVSFHIDGDALKKKFYKLSRAYHPDHSTLDSPEKQEEAMQMSGMINTAYKILQDKNSRLKYILDKYGLLKGTENEALPHAFLLQMMDINEAVFEATQSDDKNLLNKVLGEINQIQSDLNFEASKYIDEFENQRNRELALENLKYYYLKSKYLLRIRENLSTFAHS